MPLDFNREDQAFELPFDIPNHGLQALALGTIAAMGRTRQAGLCGRQFLLEPFPAFFNGLCHAQNTHIRSGIQMPMAIIIKFSVSDMKPSGTLLLPPTQAHLSSRRSM